MAEAAAAGIPTDRFWQITPRELRAEFKGASKRFRNQAKLALFTAWQTASFMPRRKRMPPLAPMLHRFDERRDMSSRELRTALLGWHKAAGGSVRVVPKDQIGSI